MFCRTRRATGIFSKCGRHYFVQKGIQEGHKHYRPILLLFIFSNLFGKKTFLARLLLAPYL